MKTETTCAKLESVSYNRPDILPAQKQWEYIRAMDSHRRLDLFRGVNCNCKAVESHGGVERRYIAASTTAAESPEVAACPQLVIRCSINNYG